MSSNAPVAVSVPTVSAAPIVGFDTETYRFTRHDKAPQLVCLSMAGGPETWETLGKRGEMAVQGEDGNWEAMWRHHDAPGVFAWALAGGLRLVGHNTPYDVAVLLAASQGRQGAQTLSVDTVFDAIEQGRLIDTQVRANLLAIAHGTFTYELDPDTGSIARYADDLAACVRRHFDVDLRAEKTDPNGWRQRYGELFDVPLDAWPLDAIDYAMMDAYWPIQLYWAQARYNDGIADGRPFCAQDTGAMVGEQREYAADLALHLMSVWGLRADPERVVRTVTEWEEDSALGRALGRRIGVVRVKGRDKGKPDTVNKKALQALVVEAYARNGQVAPRTKPSKTYPQGQVSAKTDVLRDSLDDTLNEYADSLQATNYLSKYVWGPVLACIGPLTSHPCVLVESGRTAWANPPLQQPPRKGFYRSCYVPREGWLYCTVDYDTAELCSLAQVCLWTVGSSRLGEVINAGQDPHLITAQSILAGSRDPGWMHATYDMMKLAHEEEGGNGPVTDARQAAKPVNFGYPGGLGPLAFVAYAYSYSLSYMKTRLRFSIEEATALKEAWLAAYDEMPAYFRWVKMELDHGHTLEQFVSGRIRHIDKVTKGFNTLFQGLTADGAKYAAWCLCMAAYTGRAPKGAPGPVRTAAETFYGCRPVLFLHDEILCEVPDDGYAHERAEAQATIMQWAMSRHTPDIRARAKPVLMRRWLKGAKQTYDAQGRLVPTEEAP